MKKNIDIMRSHIVLLLSLTLLLGVLVSCHEALMDDNLPSHTEYTYSMTFDGNCAHFDGNQTRSAHEWAQDEVIYLHFMENGKRINGRAVYDADNALWTVTSTAQLQETEEGVCMAVFIQNPASTTGDKVQLSAQSVVYRDNQASYSLQDGEIKAYGLLTPQTGRIQFRGVANSEFTVSGLSFMTEYAIATDQFSSSSAKFTARTLADGCSEYYYATFADEEKLELIIDNNESEGFFQKSFGNDVLGVATSGYITIPTTSNPLGWEILKRDAVKAFTVNGVTFTMEYVEKGSFTMGATSEQMGANDNEKPAHKVTLTKCFYLGTYEVTQELYQAVMGGNPSSYKGNKKPVTDVSWNDCQNFITKLNSLTGQKFRLPTEAEWEFAARGGNESKGYLYSGSNNIEHVAYYNASGGPTEVGEYNPNELGIYDMSGNVQEWCQDWYGSYSSGSQTDPTGPTSGSYRVFRGGSWYHNATVCRVAARLYFVAANSYGKIGFRLALSCSQNEESSTIIPSAEAVDLGLSVKWASFNVGATRPEEYGDYFAWGETELKNDYSWNTYKWCNVTSNFITKYCTSSDYGTVDSKKILDPEDDVARVKWGGTWRIPTAAEIQELLDNCTWMRAELNGVSGYTISAGNGNRIFLPTAGYRYGTNLYANGYDACYWSTTLYENLNNWKAFYLYSNVDTKDWLRQDRWYGLTIRPVSE